MAHIHTAKSELVKSLLKSPDVMALVDAIERALIRSFKEANMAHPTVQEQKRRFDICMDWALVLRGDLKWPVARICDSFIDILRVELSGQQWKPSERKVWIPTDGVR